MQKNVIIKLNSADIMVLVDSRSAVKHHIAPCDAESADFDAAVCLGSCRHPFIGQRMGNGGLASTPESETHSPPFTLKPIRPMLPMKQRELRAESLLITVHPKRTDEQAANE